MLAADGHWGLVSVLTAANAEVRCINKDGTTALMLAAKAGKGEIVHVLLAAKADVQTKSKDGSTALMVAAASGNCEIASALIVAKCGGAQCASTRTA